ncbi:hypothetical protein CDL15_Pgr015873 [Punica granatum]|uniref:Uncharacterized protein n=1 Tax=Punica granatum TaxID=22663 RepID=A0A218XPC7_PUNGR|nr:hypothetical protein CDL15_Pgr015873 [Punica granatum]
MFLEVVDAATLPDRWCRVAKFVVTLVDQESRVCSRESVEITLHKLVPPVELATQISRLGSYLSGLSEDFTSTGTPPLGDGSSLDRQAVDWASETPSADGIEKAKRSLKGWLSDLFILDMRERLL